MQLFEILLVLTTAVSAIITFLFPIKKNKRIILVLLLISVALHILFDGYRWQMLPIYLLFIITCIRIFYARKNKLKTTSKVFHAIFLILLISLGYLFSSNFPVFKLATPTGTYIVGTSNMDLTFNREEVITSKKNDLRKVTVKIWYPAKEKSAEQDTYIDVGGRNGFAKKYGLPNSTFNYLDKIETHVYKDALPYHKKFPVLLFSHGYNSKANNYYSYLSELASHGYIIFAINHTYESTGSTFSDGSEVYFDYDYFNKIQENTWPTMEPVIKAFKEKTSFKERHAIVEKGLLKYFVKDIVERWSLDISDVISALDSLNTIGKFKNKLALSKIGVFGHSRGGGAAGEALLKDNRIKAGVNLDGVQWGDIVTTQFKKPFLFVSADWPDSHQDLNSHAYINKSSDIFYKAKILGSAHSNFMDIPLMFPNKKLSEAGEINAKLGIEITNKLLVSFFDTHLKNKENNIELLGKDYQELDITAYLRE